MNGTAAVRTLLTGHAPLIALVPAERIVTGALPQGTPLPAISINDVSGVDRPVLSPGETRHVTDRTEVTVLTSNYPSMVQVLKQVRAAAADRMPIVSGISNVVVHTAGLGPYFTDEAAAIHMKAQDFKVSYTEAR